MQVVHHPASPCEEELEVFDSMVEELIEKCVDFQIVQQGIDSPEIIREQQDKAGMKEDAANKREEKKIPDNDASVGTRRKKKRQGQKQKSELRQDEKVERDCGHVNSHNSNADCSEFSTS